MIIYLILYLGIPLGLILVGGGVGRWREARHQRSLTQREQAVAGAVTVTNLRTVPAGARAVDSRLVIGEVVIASDYAKQFMSSIRALVGGEVRSMQRVLDRGRREALLRAVDEARAAGADLLLNVRFETATVVGKAAEIVCYATAVRTAVGTA